MIAVSVTPTRKLSNGKQEVRAFIEADNVPSPLPTDGSNVIGMNANEVFAPFSVLFITNASDVKVFITNESGIFIAQ